MAEVEEVEKLPKRADRLTVLMTATLITQDGQRFAVRVKNFSETGLALSCDVPLTIGEAVHVELRDSRVTGHVVRNHANSYGIRVTKRIDLSSLAKRPANENAFQVSKLHQISDSARRPPVKG